MFVFPYLGGCKMNTDVISNNLSRLLKAAEVAEYLNISRAMAYRLMQRGLIRTVQIGSNCRVRPKDLFAYIESNLTPHRK
jgi:excisionase family DNA binding protein